MAPQQNETRNSVTVHRDARLIQGVIANLRLFERIPPALLAGVAKQCWALPAQRGTKFARRGARLPGVLALAYGSVKLALEKEAGAERVFRLVLPGQTFGLSSALLGEVCLYDATALAESKLVVIPSSSIFDLIDRDPRFAREVVLALARRQLELLANIESTTGQHGERRLARYLQALANGSPGPCTVTLPVTKTLVAASLGIKKETLSRLFRALSEQGLIRVERREIALLDRERLSGLVGTG